MRFASLALVVACASTPRPSMAPPRHHETPTAPDGGAYYERLKSAVYGEWQPTGVWKALPPDERNNAPATHTTIVRAEILPDGSLWNLTVKTSSGTPTLDQECLRAFRAAAPFPNPPAELFTDNMWAFDFAFNFEIGPASGSATPAQP